MSKLVRSSTSLVVQAGTHPDELIQVSDSGKCAQLAPLQRQGQRGLVRSPFKRLDIRLRWTIL
ncbi:hypothetical protein DVQ84_01870 [Yersinia enterocolitica]|nr:hypothetical protein [Yersinia enterocolitica]QBP97785.1 hypothetical protein YEY1_02495 [Yersinia enterocolitica subsp. palearctica]EKN5957192.1 hypothetical protein [Yersinia enterocolitica]EKN5972392.1 hypothetical protein [Yersinia enterocolitica]EKN6034981.1 hypothetical protein [Yersinia enterocolitica]